MTLRKIKRKNIFEVDERSNYLKRNIGAQQEKGMDDDDNEDHDEDGEKW
jgi:hypothetical protein